MMNNSTPFEDQYTPQKSFGGSLQNNRTSSHLFKTTPHQNNSPSDFVPLENSSPMTPPSKQWKHRRNYSYKQRGTPYRFGSDHSGNSSGGSNNFRGYNKQKFHQKNSQADDISAYFHPSMLEDPWADLERRRSECQRNGDGDET